MEVRSWKGLNATQLKLIAVFTMLLDHAGALLFPEVMILRVIGRLAYPLFAFMIAEGCRHTRNKLRYFLLIFGLGLACQGVYLLVGGENMLNILLTFSCSVLLIYVLQAAHREQDWLRRFGLSMLFAFSFSAVYAVTRLIRIDYGFWGVLTPVLVSMAHVRKWPRWAEVLLLGAGLLFLAAESDPIQHYALLSLPLLLLYNGQRGKTNMKYFFYLFYPVHLAALQGIAWLVR